MNTFLFGLVGSTAYGLNHENSDKDYCGVYAVPTESLLGLDLPDLEKATEYKNPDTKYYEALHFCRLALKSNPSILEMLWLKDYEVLTNHGQALIAIRDAFPTQRLVKAAYMGYAHQQYMKLLNDKREAKRAKNARHYLRLLQQGAQLYRTGKLDVMLLNPSDIIYYGQLIAEGNVNVAKKALEVAEEQFSKPSALAEEPNRQAVNEWLLGVRNGFFENQN